MTHLRRPFPLAAFALAAGLAASAAHAQAPQPDGLALSFEAARQRMLERSDKLAAARAGVESKSLRAEALRHLGGPVVSVTGVGYAYDARLNVDLSSFDSGLTQIGQLLPASLQSSLARLPVRLPDSYTLQRDGHGFTSSVSAIWPLYTGGATDAVRGFAGAQTREARADADQTGGEVDQTLVERYFGAQLAQRAAALRAQAERTIAGHDEAAQKMLAAGVISRVERLQARSAYEEARRNAEKAKDDAELAAVALARTVRADQPVLPRTPLFVLSQPVEPLGYFLDAAQLHHPGLAKVAARKLQAEELHAGEEALRRPQVLAFGTHDIKRRDEASWVAGVGVYWTLYDSIDRDQLAAASLKQVEQAERTDAQARSDISLLVERNWRALENARRQFTSMQAGIDLAQEVVRLRSAGLREGTSTTQDLIDAETNLAKVQTERAQAANDYVQALARLLQSAGISERFNDYIARADIKIE